MRDIIFVHVIIHIKLPPNSTLKNLVEEITSTFLPRLTWNFAYAFVMRCRCAWHNFHMRHFTKYWVIAPYLTLNVMRNTPTFLPRLTWNFAYRFVIRCRCSWHSFHTCHLEPQMSCARLCSSSMHQDKGYKIAMTK